MGTLILYVITFKEVCHKWLVEMKNMEKWGVEFSYYLMVFASL